MTGFLAELAARAVGEAPALRPRPVQRFEAAGENVMATRPVHASETAEPGTVDMPAADPGRQREGSSHPEQRDVRAALPADTEPAATTLDAEPAVLPGVDRTQAATAARRTVREAVAQAERASSGAAARPVADQPPQATQPPDAAAPPEPVLAEAPAPESPIEATEPVPPPLERLVAEPVHAATPPSPPAPQARPRELPPAARPTDRRRVAPRPRPVSAPVDLAALLRDEVFAALVDRGDVPPGEQAVVQTSPTTRAPRQGTTALRAEGVRGAALGGADPPAGDVHVHIDRVTVTRPQPAPVKPPTPPRTPIVDHSAYLARRRERR